MEFAPPAVAEKFVERLYLLCGITLLSALFYNHYQLVTFKVPLDYNEAGMLSITAAIAAGDSPHALEQQPVATSVYPVLYNALVAPLSLVFGNTLILHRSVAGCFILATCCLCFYITHRKNHALPDCLAVGASAAFASSNQALPDQSLEYLQLNLPIFALLELLIAGKYRSYRE